MSTSETGKSLEQDPATAQVTVRKVHCTQGHVDETPAATRADHVLPVWPDELRGYLKQQIEQAANAEERADAVRLAQRLARA
jgi:hypothetical protein